MSVQKRLQDALRLELLHLQTAPGKLSIVTAYGQRQQLEPTRYEVLVPALLVAIGRTSTELLAGTESPKPRVAWSSGGLHQKQKLSTLVRAAKALVKDSGAIMTGSIFSQDGHPMYNHQRIQALVSMALSVTDTCEEVRTMQNCHVLAF